MQNITDIADCIVLFLFIKDTINTIKRRRRIISFELPFVRQLCSSFESVALNLRVRETVHGDLGLYRCLKKDLQSPGSFQRVGCFSFERLNFRVVSDNLNTALVIFVCFWVLSQTNIDANIPHT